MKNGLHFGQIFKRGAALSVAFVGIVALFPLEGQAVTYNALHIPEVLTGTNFNLWLGQTNQQYRTGAATTTYGYNGARFWGPTLVMNEGDVVQINVTNTLADTTTVHWHGFHIPAIMDGGPHQTIPAGTVWSPTFTVKNSAATYWYHPHLHGTTQEQLTKGAGGFIIIRDAQEAALALPRTYGVDDLPLAITSRRFLTGNQFAYDHKLDNYGDYVLVNGTENAQVTLPQQWVRLRILNAEIARGYNLGLSDNRTFYVIGNDQGLLNAPVAVTRVKLMVGERVELMVNLSSDSLGATLDLKAYNSGQAFGFPGNEGNPLTPSGNSGPENLSLINNTDFNLVHMVVGAATDHPITALPTTLATNVYWTTADVSNTRTINITGGANLTEFTFNNISYTPTLFNHTLKLNAVEQWNIVNNQVFGHSFHIHDIKFKIVSRSGGTQVSSNGQAASYESGWKDTVYVPRNEKVSVIAKYDDFASNTNPFMFHCHLLQHEDGGMMGQFLVVNNQTEDLVLSSFTRTGSTDVIELPFKATTGTTYTLQYSKDFVTWKSIGSVTSDGTTAQFTETDASRLAQPRGFYRVVIPAIP
jgi:bilirubin oxidase